MIAKSLLVKIEADVSEFTEALKDSEAKLKAFGSKLRNIGMALTAGITLPIMGIGAACLKAAVSAEESEDFFERAFGDMAKDVREWSENLRNQLGLNSYAIRENASVFFEMINAMGVSKKSAVHMSKALVQLAYDLASARNIPVAEAFYKLQAAITGEIEPMKRLGYVINETNIKQWALNHGLIKQGQTMTESQKVIARFGLMLEQTSRIQGNLAETIGSAENRARIAKEKFEWLRIEVGMKLRDAYVKVLNIIHVFLDYLEKLMEHFKKLSPTLRTIIIALAGVAAAIGPVLMVGGQMMVMLSALNVSFISLIGTVGLVAGAIAGLVTVGILVWKNWDKISRYLTAIWVFVKDVFLKAWGVIKQYYSTLLGFIAKGLVWLWQQVSRILKPIGNLFVGVFSWIKNTVTSIFQKLAQKIVKLLLKLTGSIAKIPVAKKLVSNLKESLEKAKKAFAEAGTKVKEKTVEMKDEIMNSSYDIQDALKAMGDAAVGQSERMKTAFETLGITSVSAFRDETNKLTEAVLKLYAEFEKGNVFFEDMDKAIGMVLERYKKLGEEAPEVVKKIREELGLAVEGVRIWTDVLEKAPAEMEEKFYKPIKKKNKELSEGWKRIIEGIREYIANNLAQMVLDHKSFTQTLKDLWSDLKAFIIRNVVQKLANAFTTLFTNILAKGVSSFSALGSSVGGIFRSVTSGLGSVLAGITKMISGISIALAAFAKIAIIAGAIAAAVAVIGKLFTKAGKKYGEITYWLKDYNERIFPQYMEAILKELRGRLPDVKEFQASFNAVKASRKLLVNIRSVLVDCRSYLKKIAQKIQGAQSGFAGVVRRPTLFAVTERRRPEFVYISPEMPRPVAEAQRVQVKVEVEPIVVPIGNMMEKWLIRFVPKATREERLLIHPRGIMKR